MVLDTVTEAMDLLGVRPVELEIVAEGLQARSLMLDLKTKATGRLEAPSIEAVDLGDMAAGVEKGMSAYTAARIHILDGIRS